jgi:hypothetical protein
MLTADSEPTRDAGLCAADWGGRRLCRAVRLYGTEAPASTAQPLRALEFPLEALISRQRTRDLDQAIP